MYTNFKHFFTVKTRKFLTHLKVRLRLPPHLHFLTALPRKTQATANIDATCLIYWCEWPINNPINSNP